MRQLQVSKRSLIWASFGLMVSVISPQTIAQGFPEKTLSIIVPATAGGPADTMARGIAEQLSSRLKQPVVVDNVPGASGAIAAQKLLRSSPEGYTLMFGITSEMIITPLTVSSAGYATKDFTPIAKVGSTPLTLVVSNALNVKNIDELVALSKQRSGGLSIGVSGATGLAAFAAAAMSKESGINLVHIPFAGDSAIVPQVIGGQIDVAVLAMPAALPLARTGKLTMMGLLTSERSKLAPEVPTVNESKSMKGIHIEIWGGLVGPGKMPAAVVEKLNLAMQDIANDKKFLEWRTARFDSPAPAAPATEFARFLIQEESTFKGLLAGMKLQ